MQNSVEAEGRNSSNAWTQKQSTIFPSINFSHLSTYLSSHFSLHPSISPSIPLQSLQSAVSYRIPLQSSDAALQSRQTCMCVCYCGSVYTRAIQCKWEMFFYFFCYVQGISSSGTQQWCPQPIFILHCVQTAFPFFLNLECAVSILDFALKCDVLQGCLFVSSSSSRDISMQIFGRFLSKLPR